MLMCVFACVYVVGKLSDCIAVHGYEVSCRYLNGDAYVGLSGSLCM